MSCAHRKYMTILFSGRLAEINSYCVDQISALVFSIEAKYGDIPSHKNASQMAQEGLKGH